VSKSSAAPPSTAEISGGAGGPAEPASARERAEREIESLSAEILERYEEATLVYRLCDRLGSVLGERAISRLVLEDAARVLGARAGQVWLRSEGTVAPVAAVPAGRLARWDAEDEGAFTALHENRPWSVEAGEGRESVVAVPLPSPVGDPIGVLILRGRGDGRSYRSGDVKLLVALAALSAAFIRNDRLAGEARRTDARRREDEITREIHHSLLPEEDPAVPGLEISGTCRAAENVGGDYYGYISLPDGGVGVAMADVAGHGVGAALYMAAAKGALHAEARRVYAPGDLLHRTNEALVADFSKRDVFATAFFARFRPGGRGFAYANAGHNPPLLVKRGGEVELLRTGGPALGILPGRAYAEEEREFNEGDLLVVYTDGLVEARDPERRFYGIERLIEQAGLCRGEAARTVRERLLEDLFRHRGAETLQDDITLVVIRAVASPFTVSGEGSRQ
jgi:sigma-B regulation protein RsbU (phosphoserine phosphatase)